MIKITFYLVMEWILHEADIEELKCLKLLIEQEIEK